MSRLRPHPPLLATLAISVTLAGAVAAESTGTPTSRSASFDEWLREPDCCPAWSPSGRGGKDIILGGDGNDCIEGGAGEDWLFDGAGNDTVVGRYGGKDIVDGGPGRDRGVADRSDTRRELESDLAPRC